jgi:hypothetical protein
VKKIYAKLTKERALPFQIETAIYEQEDGTKMVEKRPLSEAAQQHVKNMFEYYCLFQKTGIDYFLPCEMHGMSARFPFVTGQSYYDKVIRAAKRKEKETVIGIFEEYQKLFGELYQQTVPFEMNPDFAFVFGNITKLNGMEAAANVDIDLTLDNIICEDGKIRILDYEWIFDFAVPVKFPVYRAIHALFVKDGTYFEGFMSQDEMYEIFGISKEERSLFAEMNVRFMEYVEGYDESYQKLLDSYRKPEIGLGTGSLGEEFAQVYWGKQGSFSKERMQNYMIKKGAELHICVDVHAYEDIDCIRIDPCNWPGMIQIIRLEAETENTVRKLSSGEFASNAMDVATKTWVFQSEDPQIIIPIQPKTKWKKIVLVYKLVIEHLENMKTYAEELKNVYEREWKLKAESNQVTIERQEKLLTQCAHKMREDERRIQLLEDKLAYIENTKAFKLVLKKKVGNIRVWDELNQ